MLRYSSNKWPKTIIIGKITHSNQNICFIYKKKVSYYMLCHNFFYLKELLVNRKNKVFHKLLKTVTAEILYIHIFTHTIYAQWRYQCSVKYYLQNYKMTNWLNWCNGAFFCYYLLLLLSLEYYKLKKKIISTLFLNLKRKIFLLTDV